MEIDCEMEDSGCKSKALVGAVCKCCVLQERDFERLWERDVLRWRPLSRPRRPSCTPSGSLQVTVYQATPYKRVCLTHGWYDTINGSGNRHTLPSSVERKLRVLSALQQ